MKENQLNTRKIAGLKAKPKPGRECDGGGLYLQVSDFGTLSWVYKFVSPVLFKANGRGRDREMGLGPLATFGLAKAREMARACRQQVKQGIDPIEARLKQRDDARANAAANVTFKDAAEQYLALYGPLWKNARHRGQWRTTLRAHDKLLGHRPVASITQAVINDALTDAFSRTPETARRTKQRIERVLKWVADGKPAPQKIQRDHQPAMQLAHLPGFMIDLRRRASISAKALEFLVLTGTRTAETAGARWDEIKDDFWVIPATRMKANREHVVPLSSQALEVLQALPRVKGCPYIFVGTQVADARMSDKAMQKLLQTMHAERAAKGLPPWVDETSSRLAVPHGFRSTFRDWAGDETDVEDEVAEHALAHAVKNQVKASYRRKTAVKKRIKLMQDWGTFCSTPAVDLVREVA